MRVSLVLLLVLGYAWAPAHGFGYITSRFRPEAGYGNWGSMSGYRAAFPQRVVSPREQLLEALLGEEEAEETVSCTGRSCTANEHCCQGYLCMASAVRASGTCMASASQRQGDECATDGDCSDGAQCDLGVCSEVVERKIYGEDCSSSSECDTGRGLCCQVIRRHRQAPRKMCSYFKDPLICLGHVSADKLRHVAELTNGEKRLTNRARGYTIRK